MTDTNAKRVYIHSAERLKIMVKKFGQRNFSTSEVDLDFIQKDLGFRERMSFLTWINNMIKKGEIVRVDRGFYNLSKNSLGRKVPVEKSEVHPTIKNPLPEKLMLSKSDYQLLSWLVDRIEHLNGRSSRVADRSRHDWVSEVDWQDFVTNMLDYQILVLLENKDEERTFVIDIERCKDAFCLAHTIPLDPLGTLYYRRNHLDSHKELLTTELAEVDAQLAILSERRTGLQSELAEVEGKIAKIDEYFPASKLEEILQD